MLLKNKIFLLLLSISLQSFSMQREPQQRHAVRTRSTTQPEQYKQGQHTDLGFRDPEAERMAQEAMYRVTSLHQGTSTACASTTVDSETLSQQQAQSTTESCSLGTTSGHAVHVSPDIVGNIPCIKETFYIVENNELYRVTYTAIKLGDTFNAQYDFQLERQLNSDEITALTRDHLSLGEKERKLSYIHVIARKPCSAQEASPSIDQLQPIARIQVPEHSSLAPQGFNPATVAQRISQVLHEHESHFIPTILDNKQFARHHLDMMGMQRQLMEEHFQKVLLDLTFPSRTMEEGAEQAVKVIDTVIQDGIELQSPSMLKERIDRCAPAVETISRYANQVKLDCKTLAVLMQEYQQEAPDTSQLIKKVDDMEYRSRNILTYLQERYAHALALQKATTAAHMERYQGNSFAIITDELIQRAGTKGELRKELDIAARDAVHKKAALLKITQEFDLYSQGYSTEHIGETLSLFMREAHKGFPGVNAESQRLSLEQQKAQSEYLQALTRVDNIRMALDQHNAISKEMRTIQSTERQKLNKIIETGTLSDLYEAVVSIDAQISQPNISAATSLMLEHYKSRIGKAIEAKIFSPDYTDTLRTLSGNTMIIQSQDRATALEASLSDHSLRCMTYKVSPELTAYLQDHGMRPSDFHIMIADPLRSQLFKENVIIVQNVDKRYPLTEQHDPHKTKYINAVMQSCNSSIEALQAGDLDLATSDIDMARAAYVSLRLSDTEIPPVPQTAELAADDTEQSRLEEPLVEAEVIQEQDTHTEFELKSEDNYQLILDAPTQLTEQDVYDFSQTSFKQYPLEARAGKLQKYAYKLVTSWGPAIARGIAKGMARGLIHAINPLHTVLGPYYKLKLITDCITFAVEELQPVFEYLSLVGTDPEKAREALSKCADPFKNLAVQWNEMSDEQKIETVSQVLTEMIVVGKSSRFGQKVKQSAEKWAQKSQVTQKLGVVRETFKVANIHEFFKMPFGIKLKSKCQPMKQSYQGQRMYKVTENIPGTPLKKGDIFYLDAQHKNHLEVFTEQGKSRTVLNLDGTINRAKAESAQYRRIKF